MSNNKKLRVHDYPTVKEYMARNGLGSVSFFLAVEEKRKLKLEALYRDIALSELMREIVAKYFSE